MASDADRCRTELAALGARRDELQKVEGVLASEVTAALGRAYGTVSVAEAARLLKIHRTTVYRVYHPHNKAA